MEHHIEYMECRNNNLKKSFGIRKGQKVYLEKTRTLDDGGGLYTIYNKHGKEICEYAYAPSEYGLFSDFLLIPKPIPNIETVRNDYRLKRSFAGVILSLASLAVSTIFKKQIPKNARLALAAISTGWVAVDVISTASEMRKEKKYCHPEHCCECPNEIELFVDEEE